MALNLQVPAWLQERTGPFDQAPTQQFALGVQLAQQIQNNRAQQEYRRAQLESLNSYREAQVNQLLARQKFANDELGDASLISQWMMDPRQPPPTGLKTPKGIKTVADVQRAYADTEIGSKFAAANKAFADKIKDLDAAGALRVRDALEKAGGSITPDVATLIDSEAARIKSTLADTRVLDEQGQPFVDGGTGRPTFIQSLKTGSLHKLPPDWSRGMQLIPLRDDQGTIKGYGVPNSSGGITQLREAKPPSAIMDPVTKAAMQAEFKALQTWRDNQSPTARDSKGKPVDVDAEYQRRLKALEDKYRTLNEPTVPVVPTVTPTNTPSILRYDPVTRTFK